jgi:phosphoribosylglycinamide formyltransferase 1
MLERRIVIFASGNGSNAENLVQSYGSESGIRVVAIFCNKPGAGVLKRAVSLDIPAELFTREEMMDGQLLARLMNYKPDCIVLAGFLWLMPSDIIKAFPKRIINIHPALLPAFGGKGMYGDRVHRAVIDAGARESGITIHLVNEHYDEGAILFQARCPVYESDTAESLASRIHDLEYQHFPQVVRQYLLSGNK